MLNQIRDIYGTIVVRKSAEMTLALAVAVRSLRIAMGLKGRIIRSIKQK
jgi:hypothetical protein